MSAPEVPAEGWTALRDATISAGSVHKLLAVREWSNPHGAEFVDWRTACGLDGTASGTARRFDRTGEFHVLKRAKCRRCWPR